MPESSLYAYATNSILCQLSAEAKTANGIVLDVKEGRWQGRALPQSATHPCGRYASEPQRMFLSCLNADPDLLSQKMPMDDESPSQQTYASLLATIKERIQRVQVRAALAVNRELVLLYWGIGNEIIARQKAEGWGTKVIERLAKDLRAEFPHMKGFSRTNLLYMRAFSEAWPEEAIVQQVAGQLPWFHNCTLLDKSKDRKERLWYAQAAIENGWSRNVLVMQMEGGLYRRQGKALTNFTSTLPSPQSDLAQQVLKDPYNFDFLTLSKDAQERDIETGLVSHIQKFLLELGLGFAFVGR